MAKIYSYPAAEVAKDVINHIKRGVKPNMQKIQLAHGYSKHSAHAMKATRSQTFIDIIKPLKLDLQDEIVRLKESISAHRLRDEEYIDKVRALDLLIKNHELLAGRPTGRNAQDYTEEQIQGILFRVGKIDRPESA